MLMTIVRGGEELKMMNNTNKDRSNFITVGYGPSNPTVVYAGYFSNEYPDMLRRMAMVGIKNIIQ